MRMALEMEGHAVEVASDGIAGENILIVSDRQWTEDELAAGLVIATALVCAVLAAATGTRPELGVWLLLAPAGFVATARRAAAPAVLVPDWMTWPRRRFSGLVPIVSVTGTGVASPDSSISSFGT